MNEHCYIVCLHVAKLGSRVAALAIHYKDARYEGVIVCVECEGLLKRNKFVISREKIWEICSASNCCQLMLKNCRHTWLKN
jgi:hypothetical protein